MGHSAHVTNVRFSHDNSCLVSTGGADTSVIVWHNHGEKYDTVRNAHQSDDSLPVPSSNAYMNEDSDTDSEEEGKVCHCLLAIQ